ncbi:hypothetical protein L3Q82_024403 [Scortum barcoo]|uniref:Uncharacterized protein n=1 Tax=Scortum barcoo TaxID=214431 RepID=A0ACB8WPN8_9TELE|nr:hypothetical protein L3Q82_024403 [Scortum barcoo]
MAELLPDSEGGLSRSGPCSLPPLSTQQLEAVDARSLVPLMVATPEPGGGHHNRPSKFTAVWEDFGEAMEEDYSVGLEEILANHPAPQKGEAVLGGELLTLTGDIVGWWKKYF